MTTTHCDICAKPFLDDEPFAGGDDRRNYFAKSDDTVVDVHTSCGLSAGLEIV